MGRLGGVLGPIIGGWLAAAGIGVTAAFYLYGGVALLGALSRRWSHQGKLERDEH